MGRSWQFQEAQNNFAEVVDEALKYGPQVITKLGVETVIVLSYHDYRQLQLAQQPISMFLRQSPLIDIELDLKRDASPLRKTFDG